MECTETKVLCSVQYTNMVECTELSRGEVEGDDDSQRTLVLKPVIQSVLHIVKLRREQDFHGTNQEKVCQMSFNKSDTSD